MTTQLPITIHIANALTSLYPKLNATANKLEAQFNFQTMTANWYGNEDNMLSLTINLLLPCEYSDYRTLAQSSDKSCTVYADDVFSQIKGGTNYLEAFVALTDKEQLLIEQHKKLLPIIVEKKLKKVINLIGESLSLSMI